METSIYFYSGTGNSLWTARKIAGLLGRSELISLNQRQRPSPAGDAERIGLVFPVHIWGLPSPVIEFLKALKAGSGQYLFAVAVNAGQVAATLIQMQKLLRAGHHHLASGFSVDLPSNYIPWGGAISRDKQRKKITAALQKIERIAGVVRNKENLPPEKGAFWQNPILSLMYRKSFPHVPGMDKSFWVDEKCRDCGICAKLCPAENIRIMDGRPVWQHRCEQCFACIQWCPEEAIQHGRSTLNKKRYHHPDISLADMLAQTHPGKVSRRM